MEKNKNVEKPEWVKIVETLPEIIRQGVGNQCASVIASLVQLYFMGPSLYDAVRNEADFLLSEHFAEMKDSVFTSDDKGV